MLPRLISLSEAVSIDVWRSLSSNANGTIDIYARERKVVHHLPVILVHLVIASAYILEHMTKPE